MASQKNKRNVLRDSQESGLFRNILSFANLKQTNGFYNFLTILSNKLLFAACYEKWHELRFFGKKDFPLLLQLYLIYYMFFKMNIRYCTIIRRKVINILRLIKIYYNNNSAISICTTLTLKIDDYNIKI